MWQLQQPDKNGWVDLRISEDKRFPDGLLNSFFQNLERNSEPYQNIINHFSSNVTDRDINNILHYFKHYRMTWRTAVFGKPDQEDFYVLQKDLYFNSSGKERKDVAFFGIEYDTFYNHYRIVSIRVLNGPKWRVKRTVFKTESPENSWRKIQHIFGKELSDVAN